MYLIRTPEVIQHMFPQLLWRAETAREELYLTFDDGPVPEITPWVLDTLKQYDAFATFFCVGQNVQRYPHIYQRIIDEGHTVGNHTHNHISGWAHNPEEYVDNVATCAQHVQSDLFRPPYGRLGPRQAKSLRGRHYHIVMWDVLSGDFDKSIDPDQCYINVVQNAKPGSIIVFHDSVKAAANLKTALPRVLDYFSERGYRFLPLTAAKAEEQLRLRKTA